LTQDFDNGLPDFLPSRVNLTQLRSTPVVFADPHAR
jgi:hypothetical protein